MDPQALSALVPLGGVTLLLVYLVGTLIADRAQARRDREMWAREREQMRKNHRADIVAITADRDQQIEFQRERINELESLLRGRRKEDRDL